MQPYQRADESVRSKEDAPLNLLKNAGLGVLAGGAATIGAKATSKLVPAIGAMINRYVPDKVMEAGLNKIDPRFGTMISSALNSGYSLDEIREFLGQKLDESKEQEPAKQEKNLIERYSPELHSFMLDQIKQGRNAYQAGAIASKEKKFADVIKKLQEENKLSWADIIDQIYGEALPKGKPNMMQQESERFEQQYGQQQAPQMQAGQQPAQQGQPSPAVQALGAILTKINNKLGGP